jgi:uncharacterized membrane protein YhaH (DUF805 family)
MGRQIQPESSDPYQEIAAFQGRIIENLVSTDGGVLAALRKIGAWVCRWYCLGFLIQVLITLSVMGFVIDSQSQDFVAVCLGDLRSDLGLILGGFSLVYLLLIFPIIAYGLRPWDDKKTCRNWLYIGLDSLCFLALCTVAIWLGRYGIRTPQHEFISSQGLTAKCWEETTDTSDWNTRFRIWVIRRFNYKGTVNDVTQNQIDALMKNQRILCIAVFSLAMAALSVWTFHLVVACLAMAGVVEVPMALRYKEQEDGEKIEEQPV